VNAEPSVSLYGAQADIDRVLREAQTWFIVGLGNSPDRAAYGVARVLQQHGKRIVPIHPRAEAVHGEPGYATIDDAVAVVGAPDVVDCFVRSSRAGQFADQAIGAGAKAVWFQLDVVDEQAARRVVDAGLTMIMDRCPAIEFRRLGLGGDA
jgi:predicted CoA-binding protein